MATSRYVGIDVSKDKLDVAMLGDKQAWQVENAKEGIQKLVHQMQKVCPELIVVEATGGYQRAGVEALFQAGLPVAVVNPARVRQFARACGLLAKTDKLDAQVLAVFGQRVQPRRYEGKNQAEKQLSALLVRRKQLEEMLKAEQNRLHTISPNLRGSVELILTILKEEKKRLEERIQDTMREQKAWQEQTEILHSAPGVGVAPLNDDSGKKRGYCKTTGRRGDVRSVLYRSTLVATRYNPLIRSQYQHLLKRGKEKKLALTACMRKFLTILNAMLRDQQPFRM